VKLALVVALVLVTAAPAGRAADSSAPEIAVSFEFPDGSAKQTTVTEDDVERLTGQKPAYKLLPWVQAALRKLELPHRSSVVDGSIALTEIGGVANGPGGKWSYRVNGLASPYQLNTQTISGVERIAFSYR